MPLFGPPDVRKLKEHRDVSGLIRALSYRQDSRMACAAVRALGELGDPRAIQSLIAATKEDLLRYDAVEAMAHYLATHGRERDEHTKAVQDALVDLGSVAVEHLVRELSLCGDDPGAILFTLGELRNPRAVDAVIRSMVSPETKRGQAYRMEAARALGKIHDPDALPPLKLLFVSHSGEDETAVAIRCSIMLAMGQIGDPRVDLGTRKFVASCCEDPDARVRREAGAALKALGGDLETTLIRIVKDKKRAILERDHAMQDLADCSSVRAMRALAAAAGLNENEFIREAAVRALAKIGDRAAAPALSDVLSRDPEERIRLVAARALGQIGESSAVPALVKTLEIEPSHEIRQVAMSALAVLGWLPQTSQEKTAVGLMNKDWRMVGSCGSEAVPALSEYLSAAGPHAAPEAAEIIGRFGNGDSICALLAAVEAGRPKQVVKKAGTTAKYPLAVQAINAMGAILGRSAGTIPDTDLQALKDLDDLIEEVWTGNYRTYSDDSRDAINEWYTVLSVARIRALAAEEQTRRAMRT